jgi:hypothetical protein
MILSLVLYIVENMKWIAKRRVLVNQRERERERAKNNMTKKALAE